MAVVMGLEFTGFQWLILAISIQKCVLNPTVVEFLIKYFFDVVKCPFQTSFSPIGKYFRTAITSSISPNRN